MESSYLQERKCISMVFNTIRESIFILSVDKDNLSLTEENISRNIILRRFKLLKTTECNIKNDDYKKLPKSTFEGYSLYFWEYSRKIFVIYPFGYLLIYDYTTGNLENHFQCHGKKTYVIRNILGSPMKNSLFISAVDMRNVYHINFDHLKKGLVYQKLRFPNNESVYDLVCHPIEKYIFVACSDGQIRIFDYSDNEKIKEIKFGLSDNTDYLNGNLGNNSSSKGAQILTMDINVEGTYIVSGNGNGNIYLWDALLAMKEKSVLYCKLHASYSGILCLKFLKTKQFINLERFICLTKEGKFLIYSIILKDPVSKIYEFCTLYENSTFDPIIYPLTKYNLITSNFITLSNFNNTIGVIWPNLRVDKSKMSTDKNEKEKSENYLLFTSFNAKFFFFYDNDFPKINFPLSTQMDFLNYEDYIPKRKNKTNFQNLIYTIDNFYIYQYEILSGTCKKLINYSKEIGLKNMYSLKFEVVSSIINDNPNENQVSKLTFFILISNSNDLKQTLMFEYNLDQNIVISTEKFDDTIDIALLGPKKINSEFLFMLNKDKQSATIYNLRNKKTLKVNIEASIIRIYSTPFNFGYCLLYRNVLNELKFSENLPNTTERKFTYKCTNENEFKLDFSEREVDVVFTQFSDNKIYCAISMIDKIIITDDKMKIIYSYKMSLVENQNIISSLFWIGKTLIYSQGSNIYYLYGDSNIINQKMFSNNRDLTFISGVLPDRLILANKNNNDSIDNVIITTPMVNPIEPILIGYLDNSNVDYNLVRECVVNMFTNQISQNLIDKFNKKNLKEVAWLFISDSKSSFQNVKIKIQILNDLLQFDKVIENCILSNGNGNDLKNEMILDELIWKLHYDQSIDYIKNLLQNEIIVLIKYGQFDKAVKILELLGDYPKILDILLITNTKEEFEKLRVLFQAKKCLSYTDNLLINNAFCVQFKQDETNKYNMNHYSKIFDKYKGEHFAFGANQEKFNVNSIKGIENQVNKKTSFITNITKKILTYGEKPYDIYVNYLNKETKELESKAICSIILQKIEHFYGMNNTIMEDGSKGRVQKSINMNDINMTLSQLPNRSIIMNNSSILEDSKIDISVIGEDNEGDVDFRGVNFDDISEVMYLTGYYHCDKGNGVVVEDITDYSNDGLLSIVKEAGAEGEGNALNNQQSDDALLWSSVLDEFEPLEYEDKWGRKSPGPHCIKFSTINKTKMTIKPSPSLEHINKRFTIEMWCKLVSINITLIQKNHFSIEIQNGEFKLNYNKNILQGDKIKDYTIPLNSFVHICFIYTKRDKILHIYLNCDEVISFNINLEKVHSNSDLIIGNGKLDGEVTEIRIWNNAMPIGYIKENYKIPLPILAENKRKLKMKIHKIDNNMGNHNIEGGKKKFGFGDGQFVFGNKGINNNVSVSNNSNVNVNIGGFPSLQLHEDVSNSKNMYEFNPYVDNSNNINNVSINNSIALPSLKDIVNSNNNNNNLNNNAGFDDTFPSWNDNNDKNKIENPYENNKEDNFDPTKFDNFEMNNNFGDGFDFGDANCNNFNFGGSGSGVNNNNNGGIVNPYEIEGGDKFKIDEINNQNFEFNMENDNFNFKFEEDDNKNNNNL